MHVRDIIGVNCKKVFKTQIHMTTSTSDEEQCVALYIFFNDLTIFEGSWETNSDMSFKAKRSF